VDGQPTSQRAQIEAEASRLVVRLSLDPGPEETEAIYRWIDASSAHAIAFARAEAAWEASDRLKAGLRDAPVEPDPPVARRLSRRMFAGAMIAASLFVAATVVTVHTLNDVDKYSTDVGEVRDVALADGSKMHLNSGTTAEVRYTEHGRRVRILQGEASFDVAHDKARPFDVEAKSAVIRAVGTAFNVRMRSTGVELTVTEGTVQVRAARTPIERVSAGNGAIICPQTVALTRLGKQEIGQRLAWRERMVELNGETLDQAVAEFNRYREKPILIGDPRVSSLRIGGRFGTADSSAFLAALAMSLPVKAVESEDGSVMLFYRDDHTTS
jgi:transmembrane sensor